MIDKEKSIQAFEGYLEKRGWEEREYQRESLEKIVDEFNNGKRMVMSNIPVGGGKTIINWAVAMGSENAYYITGNLGLQDQIMDDKFDGIKDIRGRSNYECMMINASCDEGFCIKKRKFKCEEMCNYKSAKKEAMDAKICMSNIFYFILEGGRGFSKRDLLIVDEGHNLPEQLVQFSGATISKRSSNEYIAKKALKLYLHYDCLDGFDTNGFISSMLGVVDNCLDILDEKNERDDKEVKEIKRLEDLQGRLENSKIAGEVVVDTVQSGKYEWIKMQPLYSRGVSEKLIFKRANMFLISSGTINPLLMADELGVKDVLGSGNTNYFQVPSSFPVESRKIYLIPVCNFKFSNQNIANRNKIMSVIVAILNKHSDERGIIFSQGYRYNEMLDGLLYDYPELGLRLVFHRRDNRKKVINKWMSSLYDNKVLVGIKVEEGLDMKGDIARFSILFKTPFADSRDLRVSKRIEMKHWDWYMRLAQQTLSQAYGRIVRDKGDHGSMYILDEGACKLFKRRGVPKWVREAMVDVNYKDFLKEYGVKGVSEV